MIDAGTPAVACALTDGILATSARSPTATVRVETGAFILNSSRC